MKMNLDKIGMTASQICGFHCLLMPFVFVLFPFASVAFIKGELFELAFIGFSFVLACFALTQGFMTHRKWYPMSLAAIGFFIFAFVKLKFEHAHETFSGSLIFVMAGMLVFFAHYLNHKFIHHHSESCTHENHN